MPVISTCTGIAGEIIDETNGILLQQSGVDEIRKQLRECSVFILLLTGINFMNSSPALILNDQSWIS